MSEDEQIDVTKCPFCEDEGRESTGGYDGRILRGGRGIYRCPENPEHQWQNADEKPARSGCGVVKLRASSPTQGEE